MKKNKIVESYGNTFYLKGRGIPKGCHFCLKGAKTVLFLNGFCQKPNQCSWYCPISMERRNTDNTFANEIQITRREDLIEENRKINAKGMSITGGDPLLDTNIEKTIDYIKYVKNIEGDKFHIHLYTNGINFDKALALKLAKAGLDELRFHPSKENWRNIEEALNLGMSVGAEVPVIPDKKSMRDLEEFILYLDQIGAEFINLNEFEFCFPNSKSLKEKGYTLKAGTIATVENSKEMAIELLEKLASKINIKLHFCTTRAKDHFQLKNRYLRRAEVIKLPYEEITPEGLLLFAQIEGSKGDLVKFHKSIKSNFKISEKLLKFNSNNIKLPVKFALKESFILLLDKQNNLNSYIIETIPFRAKYSQITEKTPIKVFKQEVDDF
ncbi:MAG: radical SAM protein [Promethearchaeota archaeon]